MTELSQTERIERNDKLANITLAWFALSKKDRQYGINVLLSRGLVEFNDHLELVLTNGDENVIQPKSLRGQAPFDGIER